MFLFFTRSATDELSISLKTLNMLAKKLNHKRRNNGALALASPEVRIALQRDSQDPVDVEMKEMKEANSMVEEFMLLANISVAEKIHEVFQQCSLLRYVQEKRRQFFFPNNFCLST